ncbi:MAG: hypothetical protein M3Y56_13395 [Armatimonadota bacterium]|nr:hypothetical protein [Armatimonadota bacterium]
MAKLYIEGAGFCMESGTDRTPDNIRFYIFTNEQIECGFDSREEAQEEYRRRCRLYWNSKMDSSEAGDRLLGARGILSLDKSDVNAWGELARNGSQSEKTKAAFWLRKLSGVDIAVEAS